MKITPILYQLALTNFSSNPATLRPICQTHESICKQKATKTSTSVKNRKEKNSTQILRSFFFNNSVISAVLCEIKCNQQQEATPPDITKQLVSKFLRKENKRSCRCGSNADNKVFFPPDIDCREPDIRRSVPLVFVQRSGGSDTGPI